MRGSIVLGIAVVLAAGTVAEPAAAAGHHPAKSVASAPAPRFAPAPDKAPGQVRFATYNASLNRGAEGELVADLSTPDDPQAANVAEVIQRVRPDVLLLNEFDHDPDGRALARFQDNYLSVPHNGARPIHYPYRYAAPSNTGVPSGHDLNNDGVVGGPDDAYGFGFFPGQFGMAVYSKYPIDIDRIRTFRLFRWRDLPGALIPPGWYSPGELADLRLSSKSHWDVPVRVGRRTVHLLVSHPTPPVFDGPEDRNGRRNTTRSGSGRTTYHPAGHDTYTTMTVSTVGSGRGSGSWWPGTSTPTRTTATASRARRSSCWSTRG